MEKATPYSTRAVYSRARSYQPDSEKGGSAILDELNHSVPNEFAGAVEVNANNLSLDDDEEAEDDHLRKQMAPELSVKGPSRVDTSNARTSLRIRGTQPTS